MCLLAIAWRADPRYQLVVSANRDEYYARPAAPMHWWEDAPILAGRDLEAGGTWLGISRGARFAALTNVRGANTPPPGARSRGSLVTGFLGSDLDAASWCRSVEPASFAGFNLLVCDGAELWCLSNTPPVVRRLDPGVHALGNAQLDHSWPKIEHAREQLATALHRAELRVETLLTLLASRRTTATHLLPDSGLGREFEELLSSPFIVSAEYGTRASTALLVGLDGTVEAAERSFERGEERGVRRFSFAAHVARR